MQVRLLRPINNRKIGSTLTVDDGVAELWILQRKAERVEVTAEVESMVPAPPSPGGRGRTRQQSRKGKSDKVTMS